MPKSQSVSCVEALVDFVFALLLVPDVEEGGDRERDMPREVFLSWRKCPSFEEFVFFEEVTRSEAVLSSKGTSTGRTWR